MTTTPITTVEGRVADSLNLLSGFLTRSARRIPVESRLLTVSYDGIRSMALGGKHLRSKLVHLSAGEVTGQQLHAATVFGASVDLLHAAFLIHDDVIDRDDLRRGEPTIHARIREQHGDAHLGASVAIVAGDLGINGAVQLLAEATLDDAVVRQALRLLTSAAHETFTGEILDISHTTGPAPDLDQVRLCNDLKTSEYSFTTPLKLGALAAGRDTAPMAPIGASLGRAYQAADDIAGAVGDSRVTGKQAAGDLIHGRATLMTTRLGAEGSQDPAQVAAVVEAVVAEGDAHLQAARRFIDEADLASSISSDLLAVADRIERMLRTHV